MPAPRSPGPVYALPTAVGFNKHDVTKQRMPCFSLSPRLPLPGNKACAPGPQYTIRNFTQFGKNSPPAYTIKSRPKPLTRFQTPGPGAHSPEKKPNFVPKAPSYSMQGRTSYKQQSIGPGPAYQLPSMMGPKVPNKASAAAYTLSGRHERKGPGCVSPGPANYPSIKPDIYKNALPKYTMSARIQPLRGMASPGPAAYLPKKLCGEKGLAYSVRPRLGEIWQPYITPEDNTPCAGHGTNQK